MLRIILISLFTAFIFNFGYSQGCSDAGFCTLGAMRPNQKFQKNLEIKIRSLEFTNYFGLTDFKKSNIKRYDFFISQIIDANFGLTNKLTLQLKIPINTTIGTLGNISGISDVSVSFTQNLVSQKKFNINGSIGTKIPLSQPNKKSNEGLPLPMYYQPTLGTYDFISGLSISNRNWLLATGFQFPFNSNSNQFVWSPWSKSPDSINASMYPRSMKLKRGYDIMLRIERNFRFSKWNVYTGILPIYRLKKDAFFNPNKQEYETVNGSEGLATTLLLGGGIKFTTKSNIKFLFGHRITKRKTNLDGLSRLIVTSITYEHNF